MPKRYKFTAEFEDGTTATAEGHSDEDCHVRAASIGAVKNIVIEENPEYSIEDMIEDGKEVVMTTPDRNSADKSDKQVLAEANASLFNKLDALKNKCLDIQAVILAWNTEQIAEKKEGYTEPAFVALARELV